MSETITTMPELTEEMQKLADKAPGNAQALEALSENAQKDITDPTYDPMSGALTLFGLYGPALSNLVDQMSIRQMKRFIKALVKYPLEGNEVNPKDPIQVEAYKIADKMIQSKFLLILSTAFEEKQRQEMAKQEFKKTQEEAKALAEKAADVTPKIEENTNA